MGTIETGLTRLRTLAEEQCESVALVRRGPTSEQHRTWAEVARRIEHGAAGLVRTGLHAGQVVLIAVPLTADAIELQHAVRSVGATPLHVRPDVDAAALAAVLGAVRPRFVVVETEEQLSHWDTVDLRGADRWVLGVDGAAWDRMIDRGVQRLEEDPALIRRLDALADHVRSTPHLHCEDDGSLRILTSDDAVVRPEGGEVRAIAGTLTDPSVQRAIAAHLRGGWTAVPAADAHDLTTLVARGIHPVRADPAPTRVAHLGERPAPARGEAADLPRRHRADPPIAFSFRPATLTLLPGGLTSSSERIGRPEREQEPSP